MKKLILCFPIVLFGFGCGDTGDVPIEPAKPAANATPAPAAEPGAVPQPQNTGEALRSNPNLPPAAKEALMGKGQ